MEPLRVPASLESLSPIGAYVLSAATAAGLDKRSSYRLRLAVDEIATNIVNYGYKGAGLSGDLLVQAEIREDTLTVTVVDTAIPFDPRGRGEPGQVNLPMEERPIGGLGLFLAVEGVDEFQYEYSGGQNRNIFIMKRQSQPPETEQG